MGRRRLGVVLLVPPPLCGEIDGLRRALGDGALGRVPPHLTLVPPVNVREDRLGEVLAALRRAATATSPFTVTLGPPATFRPAAPVVHLPAGGAGEGPVAVVALRGRVFVDPLARPVTHPFVPHVTLADEAEEARLDAAPATLRDYVVEVTFDAVHLLGEGPGRVWRPVADAPFRPAAVVARGPMEVELTLTALVDPEAAALVAREWPDELDAPERSEDESGVGWGAGLVVTARRGGAVAGVAVGTVHGPEARLLRLVVAAGERRTGVGSHLVEAFLSAAAGRRCVWAVADVAPGTAGAGFLLGRGWRDDGRAGARGVRLIRPTGTRWS